MKPSPDEFKHYVDEFNAMEPQGIVNLVPNSAAWDWMRNSIPIFSCPDAGLEQMYYFRWWTYRKHFVQTPIGVVMTEFITPVKWAGKYNTISCSLGHHLTEGRWLRDTAKTWLDQYARFWFIADNGKPEAKFHNYSSWFASALYNRSLITSDRDFLTAMLPDLDSDYAKWETERRFSDGRFWQFDVRDGMEESISGSRTYRNVRPTINSYMFGNAKAIAAIAGWANQTAHPTALVEKYTAKAAELKQIVQEKLWDADAKFFKVQAAEGGLSDAREAIGFIPWYFNLPDPGYESAWAQLIDPAGFWAPYGLTTAERRHPAFRSHGVGQCEWDGAVWPFATSQTLTALANVLRYYPKTPVTRAHYLEAMNTYVKSQHWEHFGPRPYIGEYLDEVTGAWLKGPDPRSIYYNHSTFCDLVISGLVGLIGREDKTVELNSLLPPDAWPYFSLENIPYHGQTLNIYWDRDGSRFGTPGLTLELNGKTVAHANTLSPLLVENVL